MGNPTLLSTALAPTGPSSGPHSRLAPAISAARTTVAQPTRVLICIESMGVRELMRILLANAGCAVAAMDIWPWLVGDPIPGPPSDVVILDAWPLRHADAVLQARARLVSQPAAVVLLLDGPLPTQLVAQLGAIATLPLLFTLDDLVTAVQLGASAQAEDAQTARVVGAGVER